MFVTRLGIVYAGSLLLHAGVALGVLSIHVAPQREPTTIAIQEVKRPKPKPAAKPPEPPPAPPSTPEPAPAKPAAPKKAAPKPVTQPAAAPPPTAAASAGPSIPDFGLSLAGGAVGAGGIAVPVARPAAPEPLKTTKATKTLSRTPPAAEAGCVEAITKPKPLSIPQPSYPEAARTAGIAGKVRVELTVDESGRVVNARVLEGLGHGLDEAALEAARAAQFEPAQHCGKPTKTSFVIGMRFTL